MFLQTSQVPICGCSEEILHNSFYLFIQRMYIFMFHTIDHFILNNNSDVIEFLHQLHIPLVS